MNNLIYKLAMGMSLMMTLTLLSCGGDEECNSFEAAVENVAEIQAYLSANGITAERTEFDLFYVIEEEGDGTFPTIDNNVTVHYRGYLLNGDEFDSSYSRGMPATFPLRGVVPGWQVGIPLFSKGGKGKLFLPNQLGYGCFPPPGSNIPAGGVIVFDVELIDIQ